MWSGKKGSISSVTIQKGRQGGWGRINRYSPSSQHKLGRESGFWGKKTIENNSSSLQPVPLACFQNRLFSLHRDETMLAADSQGAKSGRDRTVWRRIGPSLFVNPDFGFLPVLLFFHSRLCNPLTE